MLCGLVTDMIGAEAGDNAVMGLRYDPLCNWSFADAALFTLGGIAQQEKSIAYEHCSFSICTDNILADPLFRKSC